MEKIFGKKENFELHFLDDDDHVANRPEIYCGDDAVLPEEYDVMGTRFRCLKKGVGVGMNLPNARRDAFLARGPRAGAPRIYCGNQEVLPAGYTRMGLKSECLKKGVGVGLAMDPARRAEAQARPLQTLGKKELMDLARRFRITTHDKTREEVAEEIADRMI